MEKKFNLIFAKLQQWSSLQKGMFTATKLVYRVYANTTQANLIMLGYTRVHHKNCNFFLLVGSPVSIMKCMCVYILKLR